MKRLKVNIIYLIGLLVLISSIGVVFAAFMFNQVVNVNGEIGGIKIDSKKYVLYNEPTNLDVSSPNYKRALKLRKDTVLVIESLTLKSDSSFDFTDDLIFVNNKIYYTKSGNQYTPAEVEVGAPVDDDTYYEEVKDYVGVRQINSAYDKELEDLTFTIVDSTSGTDKISTLTTTVNDLSVQIVATINKTKGIISKATVSADGKRYKAVIGADGLSIVVLDKDVMESASGSTKIDADENITCSATENKSSNSNIYLSQLGLEFSFTAEIACYVRIHIQDAWKQTKIYNATGTVMAKYIVKEKIDGKSPFAVEDEEWYYDEEENYVYLREMYVPETDENGDFISKSYTFNVNEAYYYYLKTVGTYSEFIDIDVSFTVDIVQANRAKALWHIDPSTTNN